MELNIEKPANKNTNIASIANFASLEFNPMFDNNIYENLPDTLREYCEKFGEGSRERDIFLLSAITVLSGCFSNTKGQYGNNEFFPNLFSFIVAPPASGKGVMKYAKQLGEQIHLDKLMKAQEKKNEFALLGEQKLPELFFMPGNSSSAAVMGHMNASKGCGVICETEADTVANAFKNDWGSYSDMLRKAFANESISSSRKKNNEHLDVQQPKLALSITGTPNQVSSLIHSADDGLFSRFMFYSFYERQAWKNVSPSQNNNLCNYFHDASFKIKAYKEHLDNYFTEVSLSDEQWDTFNSFFDSLNQENEEANKYGTIFRLGTIAFKIIMVLTSLRKAETQVTDEKTECYTQDLEISLSIVECLLTHSNSVAQTLPKQVARNNANFRLQRFFDEFPEDTELERKECIAIGEKIGFKTRSIDNYLKQLVTGKQLIYSDYGFYRKAS